MKCTKALCIFHTVPKSPPPKVTLEKQSPTSIIIRWRPLSCRTMWNGIALGYNVLYRLTNTESGNWSSVITHGAHNTRYIAYNLSKYAAYEFKVAARTSKGRGVFSEIKEERTMEDGMCNSCK